MLDLHIHTTYSDGLDSLESILAQAQTLQLSTIAITDHDVIGTHLQLTDPSFTSFLTQFAAKHQLLLSGGSDTHGSYRPGHALGVGDGQLIVPDNILIPWSL